MTKKLYPLISLLFCLMISSCSSLERAHYYKVSSIDHESSPEISYSPEIVIHHGYRKYVALTYKQKGRFLWANDVQQVVISVNYFFNQLAAGPIFLPVIPLLGSSFKINKNEKIELFLQYGATGPFYNKLEKPVLPELVIVTKSRGVLTPMKVERFESGLRLIYDTTIEETPEFLIRENVLRLDRETLKIPRLKFVFDDSLHYEWMVPIGG